MILYHLYKVNHFEEMRRGQIKLANKELAEIMSEFIPGTRFFISDAIHRLIKKSGRSIINFDNRIENKKLFLNLNDSEFELKIGQLNAHLDLKRTQSINKYKC